MDYLFFIIFAVLIVEMILSGTWNRAYFSKGIPLFTYVIQGLAADNTTLSPEALTERFSGGWSASFLFRALTPTEIAFREKMLEFRLFFSYTPIMHGLISVAPEKRTVRIVGFMNWWICLFSVFAFYASQSFQETGYIFAFGFLGVFGLIYAIQRSRYRKIGDTIAETLKPGVQLRAKGDGSPLSR